MQWVSTREVLPALGERVLIPTSKGIEIAVRTSTSGEQLEGAAYVWEIERTPSHYDPRAVTHWMSLPSRP